MSSQIRARLRMRTCCTVTSGRAMSGRAMGGGTQSENGTCTRTDGGWGEVGWGGVDRVRTAHVRVLMGAC
jgi:hypothetical protein